MGDIMHTRRSIEYYYKSCDIEKLSSLDKKRYELMNEYGYNLSGSNKRTIDEEMQIKRHKNSESK